MKPLLVGESNPYGGDPAFALYPSPPGCAGDRLCRLVMGLDPDDYLARFDRTNLCARAWDLLAARSRAAELLVDARARNVPVVLLGAKVASVCAAAFEPFRVLPETGLCPVRVILPHPSGRCRVWSDPRSYELAREALRAAGALPPILVAPRGGGSHPARSV
jgi:hypothetical protein